MAANLKQVTKKLKQQLGTLDEADKRHFDLLIDSYRVYFQAADDIEAHGVTDRQGVRAFVNPSVAVKAEAWKQIQKTLKLFGLLPTPRQADGGDAGWGTAIGGEDDD